LEFAKGDMVSIPTQVNWLSLFAHFASFSLLSVGGSMTTAPDMHRYLVNQNGWLSDMQFTSSIALSRAAPGPNVLFVALIGWNVGMNAGGGPSAGYIAWAMALLGALTTMTAIMLPSSFLTYAATKWLHHNRKLLPVRAFKAGMAPVVIALLLTTGYLLTVTGNESTHKWRLWPLTACVVSLALRTKLHILWMFSIGAVLGALGLV
jgi:chromate transporter